MDKLQMIDLVLQQQANGASRDAIIIGLVGTAGISINKATNLYAEVAKAEGWSKAITSHKDAALAELASTYGSQWDADDVKHAVIDLTSTYGIAESTARDYCKAYSDLIGVDHPVTDPRTAMFDYLIEHSDHMSYDELKAGFKAFAKDLGRSDSNINEYWKGYDLHVALTAAKS